MMSSEHTQSRETITVLFVGAPEIDPQAAVQGYSSRPVTVDVVSNGQEAIQWFKKASNPTPDRSPPDLIFLESGFESPDRETLAYMIKSSPRLESVPVVVLMADGTDAETASEYDGNAHVSIPTSSEAYVELLRSVGEFWFEWVRYPSESLLTNEP